MAAVGDGLIDRKRYEQAWTDLYSFQCTLLLKKIDNKKFYASHETFDYSVITVSQETLTNLIEEDVF